MAPLEYTVDSKELIEIQEIECHSSTFVSTLPVSSTRLTAITQAQADDPVCGIYTDILLFCWMASQILPSRQHDAKQELPRRVFILIPT